MEITPVSQRSQISKDLLSPRTKVLSSFHGIQSKLQPLLHYSTEEFACKCFSRSLIPAEVYDKLFNHTTQSTDLERAGYLIYIIYKRAETLETSGKNDEAREVIRRFGQTVYEVDSVLRLVGEEIMSLKDSRSLISKQEIIKPCIECCLAQITTKLMSISMISDDDYDTIIDPESSQSKRHLAEIFRTLREVVKEDYTKYYTILAILADMGPPISTAAMSISTDI